MPIVLVIALSSALSVGSRGARVLATLAAYDLGAGSFQIGILFAVQALFPFLLTIYAGRVADRLNNSLFIYWGIGGFALSLTLPYVWPGLPALYVSGALSGVTSMLYVISFQNYIGVLSAPQNRARNYSWYSLGDSAARGLGPVLVGLCIDALGSTISFLVTAIFSALCLPIAFFFRHLFPQTKPAVAKTDGAKPSSMDLLAIPSMRLALITNGVVMIGVDLFNLYMPVYTRSLGFDATTIGLILGAFGLAAFITRIVLPFATARLGERRVLALALAVPACALLVIPLTASAWTLIPLAFTIGLGLGCGQPLSMALAFDAAPEGRSAEAIGMRLTVSYGAHVFLPPIFGVFGTLLGLAPVFWICALLLGGCAASVSGGSKRRVKDAA